MGETLLPQVLLDLVATGTWQTNDYVDSRIPPALAKTWDPGADGVHLSSDFRTVAQVVEQVPDLVELWPQSGIDSERAIIIADFGLGSDNPIVLDTSRQPSPVLTIDFGEDSTSGRSQPTWKQISPDIDRFIHALGLS